MSEFKRILVVGGGGREHAIVRALAEDPTVEKLFCAPGNGGIAAIAECTGIKATDLDGIAAFAKSAGADLVFVACDDPLALGLVDRLEAEGIAAFGPRQAAAKIESSKVFSKNLMKRIGIPTAEYEVFGNPAEAGAYIKNRGRFPLFIKADGLAVGKGAIYAGNLAEAEAAIKTLMVDKAFGESGSRVVVEDFLEGPEVTVLAFTDGKTIRPMVSAQDHKRAYDGGKGPNTGGMGVISPCREYTPEIAAECMERIFLPTIDALREMGTPFKGVIYFGLMLTKDGPMVIEYNARFGDPETQAVLPRLKTSLTGIVEAILDGRLDQIEIEWDARPSACVVLASGGYPEKYETGFEISGFGAAGATDDVFVYHAGTRLEGGRYYTSGGRVLGVTALAGTLGEAIEKAYSAAEKISFGNMHYRRDIGGKR